MDEAVAGHATFIEVELEEGGYLTVTDNGRGIPVDPHPKFPKKSGPRSDHDHAARGREVRLEGLRDLRRPARRRRLGRECALRDGSRSRSRATRHSTGRCSPAACRRASSRRSGACTTGAAPRCASVPTRRSSARRRASSRGACSRWRARRPISSAGVEIRWRCAPALARRARERPGRGELPLPERPQGLSRAARSTARSSSPTRSSPARSRSPAATARSNGRSPGWRPRTASPPPTATPSRRRTAARTRAACASRSCAACASMPSGSARQSA